MKRLLAISLIFILSACATTKQAMTPNEQLAEQTKSYNLLPLTSNLELQSDSHSQAIYTILRALHAGDLVKNGMREQFNKQMASDERNLPPAYFECVTNQLNDDRVLGFLGPIYKANITADDATALASFFKTPTGEKFAMISRIGGGEKIPTPQLTPEDMNAMTPMLPKVKVLSSPKLLEDLSGEAELFGMELGLSCVNALLH